MTRILLTATVGLALASSVGVLLHSRTGHPLL